MQLFIIIGKILFKGHRSIIIYRLVSLVVLPCLVICQIPYSSSVVADLTQQQNLSNQQPINAQIGSSSPRSTEVYLVGNLSQAFTFQVAPPSIKVTYLGLNGYSLYIMGVGFSNKSKFHYDEQNNRLTVLSLDPTTVGYYSAVDSSWQTFTTVLSAINGKKRFSVLLFEKNEISF